LHVQLGEFGAEYLAQKERTKRSVRNDRMAVARQGVVRR